MTLPHHARICLRVSRVSIVAALLTLGGCAIAPLPTAEAPRIPAAWDTAPPPAAEVVAPAAWWRSWNDPVLEALIDATRRQSPTVEAAAARLRQARAALGLTQAAAWPIATASASATRADAGPGTPGPASTLPLSVAAQWEIDLWGQARLARAAAERRIDARRIEAAALDQSLAADVATLYVNLRVAQALMIGIERDRQSRAETARLTRLKVEAGFEAPANAALAQAAASQAEARVAEQQAEIDRILLALSALSGLEVRDLRARMASAQGAAPESLLPRVAALAPPALPSALLRQRPDLAALELELAALAAEVGVAEADRYPKVTLTGSVGYSLTRALGVTSDGPTWGFGPAISIPLFDAGRRSAAVEAARARHDELRAQYRQAATQAVREVEEALVALRDNAARQRALGEALAGYRAFERAAEARLKAGVGSVLELEDARRSVLAAQLAVLNLERERLLALVSLHRAIGGGVDPAAVVASSEASADTATRLHNR
jgi:NodT family efflux transporter outer membrane factor (OMF) lipoprotein